jgi:hypothetical protein
MFRQNGECLTVVHGKAHLIYVHSQNFTSLTTPLFAERNAGESGAPFVFPGEVCLTVNNMKSLLVWINDTIEKLEQDWMLAGNYHFRPIFAVLSTVNENLMLAMVHKKKAKIAVQVDVITNSKNGSHEKVDTAEEREQRKTICDNICHQNY